MIKIDIDTRCWKIPKEECFLGVESDDKVRILQFELSKNEFCDGLNFTDCNCFINYKNEDNDTIPYGITDMEVHEDGTVTFTWEVSRGATIFKGNTFAVLCAKKVREDGTITNEWNSRIGSFTVSKGLEPSSSIIEVPEIDIISQLLLVAQQANENAQTNINQSNSLLEKAEGLGYLKEEFDVLEARMNQFTSLKEGSTTGDAELQDIRVGADGKTYDTAGDAVRGQIGELKSDLGEKLGFYDSILQIKPTANLLNPEKLTDKKTIDNSGNVVNTTQATSVSEFIEVDPSIQLRVTTGFNQLLVQYDSNGNKLTSTGTFSSNTPITLESNATYIRIRVWNSRLPFMLYQSDTVKAYEEYGKFSENVRQVVNIFNSESEEEIYIKLYNAFSSKNCDVYWERGTYNFSTIFELLKTKYNKNTAYELPIGGNCRYFFNGSTIIGTGISEDANVVGNSSIFGSWRTAQSYELHDGIFIANHLIYCVHEEASGQETPYRTKYHNMRMIHNTVTDDYDKTYGLRKCIGCGTGLNPNVEVSNCWFQTDYGRDIGWHGHSKDDESTFYINIHDCWFSHGISTDKMSTHETAELLFHGNSSPVIPMSNHDGVKGWKVVSWNNEKRS